MLIYLKAAALSIVFFIVFIAVWASLTTVKEHETTATSLSSDQVSQIATEALPEPDVQKLASDGLTFEQIGQISQLGVTLEDIDSAGGIGAFGFTTGGAAEEANETSGFPSPSLVWRESWEQLRDPFYDKGPNDKG